jgi:L-ascorbate metabolism protein UlaG (beta-lactamase superfamily)
VDGRFRNLDPTELLAPGESRASIMASFLRATDAQLRPLAPLPSVRVDLRALDPAQDTVIWLGHSSFFVMLGGRRILIDPVFTLDAAPVAWVNRAFEGSTPYTLADLPPIDLLLITHDHWDHLDEPTVTTLAGRVARVIAPLGVGRYLEEWGHPPERITEADWFEAVPMGAGLTVHAVPARHFSGHWLLRNRTLWAGYVLESGARRLYFSGDTGDGSHFAEIARRFPRFDLVALDMGQYDPRWPAVHMNPEQAAQAATVLRAHALLPAHVGRFRMARHGWSEPLDRITAASAGRPYTLVTPRIGEPMRLDDTQRRWPRWW